MSTAPITLARTWSSWRIRAAALAVAALLLLTLMAGAALAWTASSFVSIHYSGGAFSGKVTSKRHFCEVNRDVKVYKQRKNRPDKFIGEDETNSDGEWRVPHAGANGRFHARVPSKELRRRYEEARGAAARCRG